MALLSGFEEVRRVKPIGKTVLTVTESTIRFNKMTAEVLGYPAYAKVLINDKTRQIAVAAATGRDGNAVKFSKAADKQTSSITLKDAAIVSAIREYFTIGTAAEGEVAYQAVNGTVHMNEKVVIFNVADAKSGTMKRRGRKKMSEGEKE